MLCGDGTHLAFKTRLSRLPLQDLTGWRTYTYINSSHPPLLTESELPVRSF